MKQPKIK